MWPPVRDPGIGIISWTRLGPGHGPGWDPVMVPVSGTRSKMDDEDTSLLYKHFFKHSLLVHESQLLTRSFTAGL